MKKIIAKLICDIVLIIGSVAVMILGIVFGIKSLCDGKTAMAIWNFTFSIILIGTSLIGLFIMIPEDIEAIKRSKKNEQEK
jgi:hypothetical protein